MRKSVLLLLVCIFGCVVSSNAQINRVQARDAEWKSYAVPKANFARQIDPEKNFVFRVPADWKQEGAELSFTGPHNSSLRVAIRNIADGYPLQNFFALMLRQLRDTPGTEVIVTRKTQIQDLEAREVYLEATGPDGETIRSTSWVTVKGPLMVMFNLQVPPAHVAEIEPFFKAVVQSVIFVANDYPAFEALRSSTIKSPAPGPIHEIESIVASLIEVNSDREAAVTRLTSLFSSNADVAVDLLLDRRPFVRAAAVQALARTNNSGLTPFLWKVINDHEPLVAEAAARAVASAPDVVAKTLQHSSAGLNTEIIARIWPFMSKDKRVQLLQKFFSETAVPRRKDPPKPVKRSAKPDVKVTVGDLVPIRPGQLVAEIVPFSNDPNVQIGALTLLSTLTPEEFKLPLARIVASNYDPLIAVGLQVAHNRGELLPVDALLKLVASRDQQVSKLAAQSLALSAIVSDIPRVEALIPKDSASAKKTLADELKLTVTKIRFRHELSNAKSPTEVRAIVDKALSDSSLADFAWRYDCENSVAGCSPAAKQPSLQSDFVVKPFAENLFPHTVRHYAAIPNPRQAVQKFYETLNGLQMDSPRAQSDLILTLGFMRQGLANQFSAPLDATTLIDYTGIDPDSPIAFGAWASAQSPDSKSSGQRRAIVLRVKDRARFERTVEKVQHSGGSFTNLADYVAFGTRIIAGLPALLPLTAQEMLSPDPSKPKKGPLLTYSFVGENDWNGLRIKTIEHRWIDSDWVVEDAVTHILFVGDTAILASDLTAIRELLGNDDRKHLADNPEFRKAIERRGDVVYFSDLKAVVAAFGDTTEKPDYKLKESGALNINAASWENSHHLVFEESDWAKPLLPFHPKEFSAPRDLLPAKTIAYWLMKIDVETFWTSKLAADLLPKELQTTSLDLKQVLPELGPECGAVILELPNATRFTEDATWAAFCKLKSNKLPDALNAGKLLSGVGPAKDFVELKVGTDSYFVTTRNGFLIVSNRDKALAAFDGKSSLATTRDYSRAVEKVPNGIVAFGGYNLEAAIAAADNPSAEGMDARFAKIVFSFASAFHSQNFFATATAGTIEARSSVAMDREGRYAVADFSFLPRASNITFATVEPTGIPISNQNRLSTLVMKVRAKAAGPIDNIKDDIKTADQTVEQKSAKELLLTIAARGGGGEKPIELPVKDPQFAQYLKATPEFAVDNQQVKDQAREIAGEDRDAWSVARKLADWTYKNLEWKHVETASAEQTLATREADCSEFSALFVAMARSLGLPARMVTGLAYSGGSFGGHAWVEVWVGKWVELDPTWGTHFVDATHIRDASNELVMSAGLNLIELEVIETKRRIEAFQKSPTALMEHLVKAIPAGVQSDIQAAIDVETLTDEFMGQGSWAKMNEGERDQMWSAYRRLLKEIVDGYWNPNASRPKMRVLHLEEKGNVAEATCLLESMDLLLKLRLVKRNDLWYLVEVLQSDTNLYSASEELRPTIAAIEKSRAEQKVSPVRSSDFSRVLLLLETDAEKALAVAEAALKVKPADQSLRLGKAIALLRLERGAEAVKLLRELSDESFAPAIYRLADYLYGSEDENEHKECITLYERYTSLEPRDPRGFRDLASAYNEAKNLVAAEAAYRKAIELDPSATDGYLNFIHFLLVNDRIADARTVLTNAEKFKEPDDDLFGSAIRNLHVFDEPENAEKFAMSEPSKMKSSYQANLSLGRIFFDASRYADALRLLETSAQLDNKAADPHVLMAMVYRKQSRWTAAAKAAQRAIDLDAEYSEAYYQLACALTRLGRTKEALTALAKSVEFDPGQTQYMVEEADLKALSRLPGFKKLIPEPAKQQQ